MASMKQLKPRLYQSPISLPEARIGRFAIQHETFTPERGDVPIISLREAFLTGRTPVSLRLVKPLRIHKLVEYDDAKGSTIERNWMSDEPQELRQAAEWVRAVRPKGHVLVGGLGLGMVASWLAEWPGVKTVTVVERSQEVIDLVFPHQSRLGVGYTVIRADILEFLKNLDSWPYDYAFLDTWQGTGEYEWWTTVMPLRRIIANKFGRRRVHCWAENIMIGQISIALHGGNKSVWSMMRGIQRPDNYSRHWYYKGLPDEMSQRDIKDFVQKVGLPGWERHWGMCIGLPEGGE